MAVTIKEIAKKVGVSHATVSDVLNNKWREKRISQETRDKVYQVAAELNYHRNILASSLVRQETQVLGLLIASVSLTFFPDIVRAVEDTAREHGYHVLLCHSDNNVKREREEIELLIEHRIAGLIITPAHDRENEGMDIFLQLKKDNVPFVLIDTIIEGLDCNFVVSDDRAGAYEAVTHLIKLGHKRIAYLSGVKDAFSTKGRLLGYQEALRDNNIAFEPELIEGDGWLIEDGYKAAKKLLELEKSPTAIYAVTDICALGVLKAVMEKRLRVPEDVAIVAGSDVGCADAKVASMVTVPLTTVRQPTYEIGRQAVQIILDEIKNKTGDMYIKNVSLKPELVIRKSCGARLPENRVSSFLK
jgi:DNA-binding LacI/PurR family transcriptional regulator